MCRLCRCEGEKIRGCESDICKCEGVEVICVDVKVDIFEDVKYDLFRCEKEDDM